MSTPDDVLAMVQSSMTIADPMTALRRERLQDYCERKGWKHSDGRWAVKEIAQHLGKPVQKISDLLGGRGSFGAKIARDLEESSSGGMPRGYLDDMASPPAGVTADRVRMSLADDPLFGAVTATTVTINYDDLLDELADLLLDAKESKRQEVGRLLARLADTPDSRIAKSELLSALNAIGRPSAVTYRDSVRLFADELARSGQAIPPALLADAVDEFHRHRLQEAETGAQRTSHRVT